MNIKVKGVFATVFAFGVGMAIPNIIGTGTIDSHEQALAIVEGSSKSSEKKITDNNSDKASLEKDDTDTLALDASQKETTISSESDGTENNTESTESVNINMDADVVFDWTFEDLSINGVRFVEADYDTMLEGFGLDKVQVEYTDGGFKINSDAVQWNKKKAYYNGNYKDDNGAYKSLYWDGEKYVTSTLDEKESTRNTIAISGSWEDSNNYSDYFNFSYNTEIENNGGIYDSCSVGNYEHGLLDEEIKEINEFFTAPFTGGDYAAMNNVLHTDEMIEKGLKDESGSQENSERYIVDTSLGKCTFSKNTWEGNNGKSITYYYEFEGGKYSISVGFREGIDSATSIVYNYKHK